MKPSQIDLNASFPPLVDTMGSSECEAAAAVIVLACHVQGDQWEPKRPQALGIALGQALDEKREPWTHLDRNPFFRPNFRKLVEKGFARWVGEDSVSPPIEFTEKGFEALRKYVRNE